MLPMRAPFFAVVTVLGAAAGVGALGAAAPSPAVAMRRRLVWCTASCTTEALAGRRVPRLSWEQKNTPPLSVLLGVLV